MRFVVCCFILFLSSWSYAQDSEGDLLFSEKLESAKAEFLSYDQLRYKKNIYRLQVSPESYESFQGMEPESQEKFLQRREVILAKFVKILAFSRVAVGFGSVIKNKIRFWRPQQKNILEIYRESGHSAAEKILNHIDQELWKSAPVIVSSTETSLTVMPRAMLGLAQGDKGFVPGVGLGVSFAIHHERNEFVFELFGFTTHLSKTLTPSAGFAVAVTAGIRVSKDLVGKSVRPESEFIFLPGPFAFTKAPHDLGVYLDPSLGFGWFALLSKVKEYKILSFSKALKDSSAGHSRPRGPLCKFVHNSVSL